MLDTIGNSDWRQLSKAIRNLIILWHSGVDAHLDLHIHAGQAWVQVHVRLGQAPGPLHLQPQPYYLPKSRSKNSPSRQRRRAKCANAAPHKQAEDDTEEVQIVKPTEEVGMRVKNHPFVNLLKKLGRSSAQMMSSM